jgi:hypothetical protein
MIALVWHALFKSQSILIYRISLRDANPADLGGHCGVSIVKGERADLERARRSPGRVPWEFMCDVYDGVRDFFIFRDPENATVAHISWLYYRGDPNQILLLGDKDCEVKFCLTLPEYRGRGLYAMALRVIQQYLKMRGYDR